MSFILRAMSFAWQGALSGLGLRGLATTRSREHPNSADAAVAESVFVCASSDEGASVKAHRDK